MADSKTKSISLFAPYTDADDIGLIIERMTRPITDTQQRKQVQNDIIIHTMRMQSTYTQKVNTNDQRHTTTYRYMHWMLEFPWCMLGYNMAIIYTYYTYYIGGTNEILMTKCMKLSDFTCYKRAFWYLYYMAGNLLPLIAVKVQHTSIMTFN